MAIFYRLLFAHLLADFVLHRNIIYRLKKSGSSTGYIAHALIYAACLTFTCYPFIWTPWYSFGGYEVNGLGCILFLVLFHIWADYFNKADSMLLDKYNSIMFLVWQTMEIMVLFIVAPYSNIASTGFFFNNMFFIVASGAVFSTFFVMVFTHLLNKDLYGDSYPHFDENFINMAFRLVLYLLLIFSTATGITLGVLWVLAFTVMKKRQGLHINNLQAVLNTLATVVFAFLAKYLIQ